MTDLERAQHIINAITEQRNAANNAHAEAIVEVRHLQQELRKMQSQLVALNDERNAAEDGGDKQHDKPRGKRGGAG